MPEDPQVRVEHHYHDPTTGQVVKGVMQYLADKLPPEEINRQVDRKIAEIVGRRVDEWTKTEAFQKLVVNAVANVVLNERKSYNREGGYGLDRRLVYLIEQQLKETLLSDFDISVTKKEKLAP